MASLYERIGGEAAVDAAVDIFYRKVLSDDRVNGFLMMSIWTVKLLNKRIFDYGIWWSK